MAGGRSRGGTSLERAREAAARSAWPEAYEAFTAADPDVLDADDLAAYADAAWWCAHLQESMKLRARAHDALAAVGETRRAGYVAWFLAYDFFSTGDESSANGWLSRARRHLDPEPECIEKAILWCADADLALWSGDTDASYAAAERVLRAGERLGAPDVVAMGIQSMGRALIARGDIAQGVTLLDEAMVSVLSGRLSPLITGWIYCNVLAACMELGDLRRAGRWSEDAQKWCEAIGATSPYHGICRVYHAEVLSLAGVWEQASADAARAAEELAIYGPHLSASAHYLRGEIARRAGDLAAAEEAFLRAHALGRDPQPGLALVRLAQGKVDVAMASIRLPLASAAGNALDRARLLAAKAEIALAAGDPAAARDAAHELDTLAEGTPGAMVKATAAAARATVSLDDGDLDDALSAASSARALWGELRAPYEEARARMTIAVACLRAGDEERARLELEAARTTFEQLGATLLAREAGELLVPSALPGGLSAREVEVLALVASGKTNRQVASALTISEHTVSRHLQNIFVKLGVASRAAATAFAVGHGLVPPGE